MQKESRRRPKLSVQLTFSDGSLGLIASIIVTLLCDCEHHMLMNNKDEDRTDYYIVTR